MNVKYPKYIISVNEDPSKRYGYRIESEDSIFLVFDGKEEKILCKEGFFSFPSNRKRLKEVPASEFALLL